jgi:hypothetical protein
MSISAVTGVSQAQQPVDQPEVATPAPSVTPFSQQLDAQGTQTEAAHGHHHHGGASEGPSQSVTSSAATAASAAGVASPSTVGSSVLNLLS